LHAYVRLAQHISDEILDGTYPDGSSVPSITALGTAFSVNPATAARAVNVLVQAGLLEKSRGVGTSVVPGARARVREQRRSAITAHLIQPLLAEARLLNISATELQVMLEAASPGAGTGSV
jgi:DNA-binding transcriptional regulator YhcF (GntR family)